MKTKIIYISGNEIFDMQDIRAAFEEVRCALNLGPDTVMFGVPVDSDSAIAAPMTTESTLDPEPEPMTQPEEPVIVEEPVPTIEMETAPDPEPEDSAEPEPEPAPKKRRMGRPKKKAPGNEDVTSDSASPIPAEDAPDAGAPTDTADKVVPILSILAAQQSATTDDDAPVTDENPDDEIVAERVTIEDMIIDDAPVPDVEKTLEQLLEKMTPLREDHPEDTVPPAAPAPVDDASDAMDMTEDAGDDSDATLEQLATEFAETQDTIADTPASPQGGKIGKLKNILPFKKAKREDPGLMGDLFGWAGIAANDDEFSIPGFFANAAQKK